MNTNLMWIAKFGGPIPEDATCAQYCPEGSGCFDWFSAPMYEFTGHGDIVFSVYEIEQARIAMGLNDDSIHDTPKRDTFAEISQSFNPLEVTPEEEACWKEQDAKASDCVNHPEHYQSDNGLECIDVIRAQLTQDQFVSYCQGNIVKYLWRWRSKAGVESLKKAQWYLNRMIGELEK